MWRWQRPRQRTAWWSMRFTVMYALLWLGQVLIIDPWAQTPFDDFGRRLTIMISYAVVQIGVGVVAGGLAAWAYWHDGERSWWLCFPLMLGSILVVGGIRAIVVS